MRKPQAGADRDSRFARRQSVGEDLPSTASRGEACPSIRLIFALPCNRRRRRGSCAETSATELAWVSKGIFISVGGRSTLGVAYDTHSVE